MSATLGIRYRFEELRTLAFGSISGAYMGIGTPLENPARQWLLSNDTDQLLFFSLDGVTDHFVLFAQTQFIDDITSNKSLSNGLFLARGDRLYVREGAVSPSSGSVYFSVMFAEEV